MLSYTYVKRGEFALVEKPRPTLQGERDAIVRVTLASICSSDVHIKHGAVPRALPGVTVGHEFVGVVEEVGSGVTHVRPGDRVAVNVETFCGSCFFCRNGWVNNCTDPHGGWAIGCRIDGAQAYHVRVPYADRGLIAIPDHVSDEMALFTGDLLSTGYWACKIGEICEGSSVLIIGAGPTGWCCALCARLYRPSRIIVCERDPFRRRFMRERCPDLEVVSPEEALPLLASLPHGGADHVIEAAGSEESFRLAWEGARPNAVVVLVAMYERAQTLPLPEMYGKNLVFKTGGVDGSDCDRVMELIANGQLDATPLITHTFPLADIERAYRLFENREDGVMKIAIRVSQ